jgi:hypothetical protein
MQMTKQTFELDEQKVERLQSLLAHAEDADSQYSAIWFGEEDRHLIGDIHDEIENQTQ